MIKNRHQKRNKNGVGARSFGFLFCSCTILGNSFDSIKILICRNNKNIKKALDK